MKILKLKRVEESIYQLTYYDFFGLYKSVKVFPYFYGWRYLKNGKEIKYNIAISLSQMSKDMKIGDFMFTDIN